MKKRAQDAQTPHTGKVVNDHNKRGDQPPTQKNQGQRSPRAAPIATRRWAAATSRGYDEANRAAASANQRESAPGRAALIHQAR
jgi:hypothetical protein